MKRIVSLLLVIVLVVSFASCGVKDNGFADASLAIETAIAELDAIKANDLCVQAMQLELTEEEIQKVKDYQRTIYTMCYSGTLVVKPESFISMTPSDIGKSSYFTISMLDEYDEVFCRYTFNKMTEKEIAAQEYKAYLDKYYKYIDIKVDDEYTAYYYSDDSGNGVTLQIFNQEYDWNDFVVLLDKDLFDMDRIDTSNRSAKLNDASIIVFE